jgi:hypothetical protein
MEPPLEELLNERIVAPVMSGRALADVVETWRGHAHGWPITPRADLPPGSR